MLPTCIWCIVCDSINQPGDLDILISKYVHRLPMWWASILPILGFLGLSVLELGPATRQTDGQTDTSDSVKIIIIIIIQHLYSAIMSYADTEALECLSLWRSGHNKDSDSTVWENICYFFWFCEGHLIRKAGEWIVDCVFAVEKYCTDVARHSCIRTADGKNISRAHTMENSHYVHDDEQVDCNAVKHFMSCLTAV